MLGEGGGSFRGETHRAGPIRGRMTDLVPTAFGRVGVADFGGMKSTVASEILLIAEAKEGKAPGVPIGVFRC